MTTEVTELKAATLRSAWDELKKHKPTQRIRECAEELGVSEAELLATTVGDYTTRLEGNWEEIVTRLQSLGRVMSLTRNDGCVLEHKGEFKEIEVMGPPHHRMATVIGPIETRVFFSAWKYGFAVKQETPRGVQQSIQFFDGAGQAITKVFLLDAAPGNKPASNQAAFDQLVMDFKSVDQSQDILVTPVTGAPVKPIDQVNQEALLEDWKNLKDTHDFFAMLRKHQVNRQDAVQIADGHFTYRISPVALRDVLEAAARQHLPIMIFAGNRGNIQIHQDKIQTVRVMDNWLNILDPDFNMHLREDLIATAWVVKKPTTDGTVTAIEIFDTQKEMIAQFFGLRKPGIPELPAWRELVATIPQL